MAAVALVALLVAACGDDADEPATDDTMTDDTVTDDTTTDEPSDDETDAAADSDEPIRIGAVLGISGRFAFVGEGQRDALRLFEEQVNAEGGVAGRSIEFVIYDDEVDETQSTQLVNRLIGDDDVVAVIGPSITVPALAVTPIFERLEVPNLTLTSAAVWETEDASFVFQPTPREEIEVLSILGFLAEELGATEVGVIYDEQPYGTGNLAFLEEFAPDFDIEITQTEPINNESTNAVPQLERLRNSGVDALVTIVGDPAASAIAQGADQIEWDIEGIGFSAIAGPRFIDLGGNAVEGWYSNGTLDYTGEPDQVQADFLESYTEAYGTVPTQFAAFAFDAALSIAAAIEHSGGDTDPVAIRDAMYDMPPVEGVNATYDYTPENHNGIEMRPQFLIVQVQDGNWQVVADTGEYEFAG